MHNYLSLASCLIKESSDHRDLHSFPTRRSSDLTRRLERTRLTSRHGLSNRPEPKHSNRHRSEEHTSELQSRGHLVCRLLLEKKKKIEKNKISSSYNTQE